MTKTVVDSIRLQLTDSQAEALTAWAEARNQPVMGLLAVLSTIRNRARAKGTTSVQEALRPFAYSCWLDDPTSTNDDQLAQMALALLAGRPVTEPVFAVCRFLAQQQPLPDPTSGATHYYNFKTLSPPAWTVVDATHHPRRTVTIGDHSFWGGVAF